MATVKITTGKPVKKTQYYVDKDKNVYILPDEDDDCFLNLNNGEYSYPGANNLEMLPAGTKLEIVL